MNIKDIVNKAAIQLNLPPKLVWKVYKNYWLSIRTFLSSVPLKDLTEEEFNKLQTSVNIPSLGKFYIDWKSLENKKKRYEILKSKKTKTTIHDSIDNS